VAAAGNVQQAKPSAESTEELAQATLDIADYIQSVSRSLQISVDADLGATVVRVLDAETDEVVRQIPSEEVLKIARVLSEQQAGVEALATAPLRGLLMDSES